ncbi:RNA polymerase sigma factor [Solirubrobacter sp. CPCC 204708]|uniref:RNA polymerase sigma factor n=1 Tax=Solirubrobacter deserti TaxID=2282478 RepID=A0ABT4RFS4_9ACTN|nr:RNA polymerase sigma factor [Solirubrobacter deserti]MBE2318094.1 RNA polymerase sigma factor [Solirubrobacter deserti]MDA0137372.1 RNA polymerase sigma factor [Solirubrobacter deserti]
MEASAVHAPALPRRALGGSLLRLRSDEQLLAAFRGGNDEAFRVLHDRYRQRLFAYVRQMLSAGSRQDAEDVLQDVFVRAYGALRNDNREMNVRAWLYRVAHNRCIDHLRRPIPPAAELFEVSRKPLHDPVEEAQRRDDLRQLVLDVAALPEQQRSALLMREIDGMTYADLAVALDVTVPAVKSLLVRARVGLVEAQEARDADCTEIRADLMRSYDRGVKASGRARKHMKTCEACSEYRGALRGMKRSFAALTPVGFAPFALAAKLIGVGGGAGGAAAGAAGGGAAACKVAAVVCTAAIATGGAVEVQHKIVEKSAPPAAQTEQEPVKAKAAAKPEVVAPVVAEPRGRPQPITSAAAPVAAAAAAEGQRNRKQEHVAELKASEKGVPAPPAETKAPAVEDDITPAIAVDPQAEAGGTRAPDAPPVATPAPPVETPAPVSETVTPAPTTAPATPAAETPAVESAPPAPPGTGGAPAPPPAG